MKRLIIYFSAEKNTTADIAEKLQGMLEADLFAIRPLKPYTKADLNYMNPLARCNLEKIGNKDVETEGKIENFDDYDEVLIGFPIWYAGAPNVVNSFVKQYDWTDKDVIVFATSGGSGIGKTAEKLEPYLKNVKSIQAVRVESAEEVLKFMEE